MAFGILQGSRRRGRDVGLVTNVRHSETPFAMFESFKPGIGCGARCSDLGACRLGTRRVAATKGGGLLHDALGEGRSNPGIPAVESR